MNQAQQQLPGTTMMYNAAGQPAVAITLTPQTSPYQLYESKQSKITGIILIGVGVLSIVFNAVGMVLRETWTMRGYGYGSAVMFIIAGAFGVAAAGKNRCLVITYLVFAILSACSAASLFAQSVIGIIVGPGKANYEVNVAIMSVMILIMAMTAAAVAIWGSAIGCKVACCGRQETGMVVSSYQPVMDIQQIGINAPVTAIGEPPAYMPSVVGATQHPSLYEDENLMLPAKM